jgi:predicted O-methyltransferase YrrM
MNKTITFTPELYEYLVERNLNETDVQRRLREHTETLPSSELQIAPEQAAFLQVLVALKGARRAIEIGVYTGYSALAVALAMPDDGTIVACDVSAEWTAIAREYWEQAGVADRIDLRLAPALETLDQLAADGGANRFDFAFIDADKVTYPEYYERCLTLLRPGGLIVMDNTLWEGKLTDPSYTDPDTEAIRAINRTVHDDPRVVSSLVNVADGMTLAVKR